MSETPDFTKETLAPFIAPYALRAAHEGIPVVAIARLLAQPVDLVYGTLQMAKATGDIAEMPKADWPAAVKTMDRIPVIARTPSEDDLLFSCRTVFHLTKLEAAFLVLLMRHDRADKSKLHNVVEMQRLERTARPDNMEMTDPKMVDVMICKLRKKLRMAHPDLTITTVWGGGYYLNDAVKAAIMEYIAGHPHGGSGPKV